jgi:hypothetical protein
MTKNIFIISIIMNGYLGYYLINNNKYINIGCNKIGSNKTNKQIK